MSAEPAGPAIGLSGPYPAEPATQHPEEFGPVAWAGPKLSRDAPGDLHARVFRQKRASLTEEALPTGSGQ